MRDLKTDKENITIYSEKDKMSSLQSYPCQIGESSGIYSSAGVRTEARIAGSGLASSTESTA